METKTAKIVRRMTKEGWEFLKHGGNHDIYRHDDKGFITVPRHKTATIGVARSIAKKAGWI